MGAINYKTSDYITLGYNCNNIDYEDDFYHEFISDLYDQIRYRLNQEHFYYFHITLEPGYYEGYSINIEFNFPICFDNWEEKQAAQKEITNIKKFLIECINDFCCVACYPGWCMGYANYSETLKELSAAIHEMRETVKGTPTWSQYHKREMIPCF